MKRTWIMGIKIENETRGETAETDDDVAIVSYNIIVIVHKHYKTKHV